MNRFRQQIRVCVCVHAEKSFLQCTYSNDDDGKNRKEVDNKVKI
jgi:hypothetical protein